MATTPNYGWETPDDSDLISSSAAVLRTTFNSIDTQVFTSSKPYHAYYPVTGNWFGANYFATDGTGATLSNAQLNQYQMMSCVFAVNNAVTLDRLAINVTIAAASTTYRLGIYNADTSGNPSTLRLDAGTVLGTTTGVKELTISHALPKGVYFLAVARQDTSIATTQRIAGFASGTNTFLREYASQWFGTYTQSFNGMAGADLSPVLSGSVVSGALPASFGTPTTTTQDPLVIARLA